jgi:mono/diheme cytochrome c family protein
MLFAATSTHDAVDTSTNHALAAGNGVLAVGKYLTEAANCVSCHTRPDGAKFAGGVPFTTKFGTIYSPNITTDLDTGIGRWTLADLRRAMHEGIAAAGYRLFPAFPYTDFTKISDADADAIYAYLRTIAPVRYSPPANGFLFSQRWAMRFWNALFFTPGRFAPEPTKSSEWNRGAYLVGGLGHCGSCHSPRNWFMAAIASEAYAGGSILDRVSADKNRRWSAVNLTSAKSGLLSWSQNNLVRYLGTGVSPRAGTFGPMNEVITNSLRHLSADDLSAMAIYLKSLPAREPADSKASPEGSQPSAAAYRDHCEKCHLVSGRGGMFNGPPLAGSAVVQTEDPASLINIVLLGSDTPPDVALGAWETMKPNANTLTDREVAAICNYVRSAWGNNGRLVTEADVAAQR